MLFLTKSYQSISVSNSWGESCWYRKIPRDCVGVGKGRIVWLDNDVRNLWWWDDRAGTHHTICVVNTPHKYWRSQVLTLAPIAKRVGQMEALAQS